MLQSAIVLLLSGQVSTDALYDVTFYEATPLRPTVTGQIEIENGVVRTGSGAIDHIERGWAEFVRDLRVTTPSGTDLSVKPSVKDRWSVGPDYNGPARLQYSVDLSFATTSWPPGNEQAGYWEEGGLFLTSRVLFIASKDQSADIRFHLPEGWKAATSWIPGAKADHFHAKNSSDLLENTIALGHFGKHTIKSGPFEFTLALIGKAEQDAKSVAPALVKVAKEFAHLFPNTPDSRYLMTFFYAPSEDGESYNSGAAFTTPERLSPETKLMWGNHISHELFHYWNGGLIGGADYASTQWFSEGVTEYFANLALVRSGVITEAEFLRKAEQHIGNYSYWRWHPIFGGPSLSEAGARKGRHRIGLYGGGWCAGFVMDEIIRDGTGGKKSLDDVMKSMLSVYGLTGKTYELADLIALLNATYEYDWSSWFNKYIFGIQRVPFEKALQRYGIAYTIQDYASEAYLKKEKDESELWRQLIHKRR